MTQKSAFPLHPGIAAEWDSSTGMSLRDWFAGMALQGLLSSNTWTNTGEGFGDFIAMHAGNIADAMMKERPNVQ